MCIGSTKHYHTSFKLRSTYMTWINQFLSFLTRNCTNEADLSSMSSLIVPNWFVIVDKLQLWFDMIWSLYGLQLVFKIIYSQCTYDWHSDCLLLILLHYYHALPQYNSPSLFTSLCCILADALLLSSDHYPNPHFFFVDSFTKKMDAIGRRTYIICIDYNVKPLIYLIVIWQYGSKLDVIIKSCRVKFVLC